MNQIIKALQSNAYRNYALFTIHYSFEKLPRSFS